jgi:hypothetical protein
MIIAVDEPLHELQCSTSLSFIPNRPPKKYSMLSTFSASNLATSDVMLKRR